jgi:hypothetical protein
MKFNRSRKSVCSLVAGLALLPGVSGCTSSDSNCCPGRDLSSEQALHVSQATWGQVPFEDLRIGNGRVAQPSRQLTVQVQANDATGSQLGSGRITFFAGPLDFFKDYQYDGGIVPDEFMAGLMGMQAGGERRFTIPKSSCREPGANCLFYSIGTNSAVLQYPKDAAVTFTVDLESVCRPRIDLVTEYSIPISKHTHAVERSCD